MFATYVADLKSGQKIYIENQGEQTFITLSHDTPGQQQRQRSGFTAGQWVAPPVLFRTAAGLVVQIETAQGRSFVQIQGNSMQLLSQVPSLMEAEVIAMQRATPEQSPEASPSMPDMQPMQPMQPIEPMRPMEPMQPMKMGDMEMHMNPMHMRMGNMEMHMGEPASSQTSAQASTSQASTRQFCTQCGKRVAPEDKFCAHCGHSLRIA